MNIDEYENRFNYLINTKADSDRRESYRKLYELEAATQIHEYINHKALEAALIEACEAYQDSEPKKLTWFEKLKRVVGIR